MTGAPLQASSIVPSSAGAAAAFLAVSVLGCALAVVTPSEGAAASANADSDRSHLERRFICGLLSGCRLCPPLTRGGCDMAGRRAGARGPRRGGTLGRT